MPDKFKNSPIGVSDPGANAAAVVPSDSTDLPVSSRALWVGGEGSVEVIMVNDTSPVVFAAVPAGTLLPLRVRRVLDTNTTATNIVAVY